MPDFGLDEGDVRWTLNAVYWLQTGFLQLTGLLLAFAPSRRFGSSFQFLLQGGRYVFAALFLAAGLSLAWALISESRAWMSRGLFIGGASSGVFATFLGAGAAFGPTGIFGFPVFCYVAAHMLLQSALLAKRR